MIQCQSSQSQQRVGVELLEASVVELNKYKLRKTHQLGNFRYDPGKYYATDKDELAESNQRQEEEEVSPSEVEDNRSIDRSTFEDELEAPWNQYAWVEELRLRVSFRSQKLKCHVRYRRHTQSFILLCTD